MGAPDFYSRGATISTGLSDSANIARLNAANVFSNALNAFNGVVVNNDGVGGRLDLLDNGGNFRISLQGADPGIHIGATSTYGFTSSATDARGACDSFLIRKGVAILASSTDQSASDGSFQGKYISSDGTVGFTGSGITTGKTLTIKDGIITGYA